MAGPQRLEVLSKQLAPGSITLSPTGGKASEDDYTVVLPEKLTADGPWDVRRWAGWAGCCEERQFFL